MVIGVGAGGTAWSGARAGWTASSSFAAAGRAAAIVGHFAITVPESDGPSSAGCSCEGQCAGCDASAGAMHVASHHARAGAAAPIRIVTMRMATRFTAYQYIAAPKTG